jgi:hypothetical protein
VDGIEVADQFPGRFDELVSEQGRGLFRSCS